MVADVDVDARLDVTIRIPLHGAASGSVSGALGTGSNSGDGMCNANDAGSDDESGLHVKVAHPFIEGGDLGLRLVYVLDDSDLDLDLDLNPGHDHGHDCAAILHWSFTALGQSHVNEITLFCLSRI